MRAVTGTITSSKPISLSKASAIITRFAAADIGARRDVTAYLKLTANFFEDLVQFHRDLRHSRKRAELKVKQEVEDEDEQEVEDEDETRSRKKEKKKGIDREHLKSQVKIEPLEDEERSKKKEKKKKKKGIDQNPSGHLLAEVKIESLEEGERSKKKRKEKTKGIEVKIEPLEEEERSQKKREGGVVENGDGKERKHIGDDEIGDESERREKKKKKSKA